MALFGGSWFEDEDDDSPLAISSSMKEYLKYDWDKDSLIGGVKDEEVQQVIQQRIKHDKT